MPGREERPKAVARAKGPHESSCEVCIVRKAEDTHRQCISSPQKQSFESVVVVVVGVFLGYIVPEGF